MSLIKCLVCFARPYVNIATTPSTLAPASSNASTAVIEEPPVEIKSSTTTTFLFSLFAPSIWFCLPWLLLLI